ncbi:MAG TPA: sugar phosphate nucleotidyltransferase [Gemmatimonadaceae bacterium]|nr:sugar phosphate nucleotidyltransferase [Gemmatimonadaceae bacterium]
MSAHRTDSRVVGVILAAGKGTRIYPFSADLPKPILPVCNQPLLSYQLEFLKRHGVTDVTIVIGHLGYAIVAALGDGRRWGVNIRYVEQRETLGMAHAVGKLEPHIHDPFILLLGDIYFITKDMAPMIARVASGEINACLASKVEHDPEMIRRNFAIMEDADGRVRRVIEKPRHARSTIKGCGLYMFDLNVFDAIRRTPRTAMRDEYEITDSIQIMIDDGHRVYHSPLVDDDMNLTYPHDLLRLNLIELQRRGVPHLVGRDVSMPPGTVVDGSVIGDDVVIEHPIRITNSLVFEGTRISETHDLDHVVVFGENIMQCDRAAVGA